MGSITCVQGQGKGSKGQPVLVPISKGIPQDVLESFGVQESQEGLQDLHLAPDWEQSTPLFSGEMREFLPAHLGDLDWSSRERSLSGCLVQSLVSGFAIHLRIGLSEEEGCQEIGLVAIMFFFELLFSYVSSSISFYVFLANLFSITSFPYLLITQDIQDEGEARFRFY